MLEMTRQACPMDLEIIYLQISCNIAIHVAKQPYGFNEGSHGDRSSGFDFISTVYCPQESTSHRARNGLCESHVGTTVQWLPFGGARGPGWVSVGQRSARPEIEAALFWEDGIPLRFNLIMMLDVPPELFYGL